VENAFEELAGLQVVVEKVVYMPDLEAPRERPHPFVYFLNIQNESSEWVQIMGRKWVVREKSDDEVVVVEGDGVVGQTPELAPGETPPSLRLFPQHPERVLRVGPNHGTQVGRAGKE